ncbi:MAG: hypothetical protein WCG80_06820 [Spirochaetales bacterium]
MKTFALGLLAILATLTLSGCGGKAVTFDVAPLDVLVFPSVGEGVVTYKGTQVYLPAVENTYLQKVASVVVPAFNDRRKLSVDEVTSLGKALEEYQAEVTANSNKIIGELAAFYVGYANTDAAIDAHMKQVNYLQAGLNALKLTKTRKDFQSDRDFNFYLGTLFTPQDYGSDHTANYEARYLLGYANQVLKMDIKHPDMSEWPITYLKGFEIRNDKHKDERSSKPVQTVTLAMPTPVWQAIHAVAVKLVALGENGLTEENYASPSLNRGEIVDSVSRLADDARRVLTDMGYTMTDGQAYNAAVNIWSYPELSDPSVLYMYGDSEQFLAQFMPVANQPFFDATQNDMWYSAAQFAKY